MEQMGRPRYILWAIIQVAITLHHYQNNNREGALSMLAKTKDKLDKLDHLGHPPWPFWKNFCVEIKKVPENGQLDCFDELFKFRFPPFDFWKDS